MSLSFSLFIFVFNFSFRPLVFRFHLLSPVFHVSSQSFSLSLHLPRNLFFFRHCSLFLAVSPSLFSDARSHVFRGNLSLQFSFNFLSHHHFFLSSLSPRPHVFSLTCLISSHLSYLSHKLSPSSSLSSPLSLNRFFLSLFSLFITLIPLPFYLSISLS